MIGCGTISVQYLATIERLARLGSEPRPAVAAMPELARLDLVAVADLDPARAQAVADAHPGVRALSVADLLADAEIEAVLNLTIPAAHAEVALLAIAAGKHVYGEKPLAISTTEARTVLAAASAAGVGVGCAPDTVLGTGIQTARAAIDAGLIGQPISAQATMMNPGPEGWHPNPDFYYAPGGGPLLDMGPYYITALVTLLGPIARVIGAASFLRLSRTIGSGLRQGESVPVSTATHVTGVLMHASGALSTLVMSFDAASTRASPIEVHGDRASLVAPDPNRFDGDVLLRNVGQREWQTLPPQAGFVGAQRGYGLSEMAFATQRGQPARASGRLAFHVLDVMESLLASAASGQVTPVHSTCERPEAVPLSAVPVAADKAAP